MKKIFFVSSFIFLFFALGAQVSLDKKYNYSTSVVQFENGEYKYYLMDVPAEQCRIYNADHSIYKTIFFNIPNDWYLNDVKLISTTLFDSDAGLELVYTYYKYIPTADSYYYDYHTKIINEDGSEILNIEDGRYNYIFQTGEGIYKLFSYCFDYSLFPEKVWTNIYNLPNNSVSSFLINENKPDIWLNVFPNPATQTVKVAYTLPSNITEAKLHLLDNKGQAFNQFLIDNHTDNLSLDVTEMSSGVYYYFVEYGSTKTASKKLVIQK